MEKLYEEKKRGSQEVFKGKILYKISYMLTLVFYNSNDVTKIDFLKRIRALFEQGSKNEMIYIIFQAIKGGRLRVKNTEKFGF